MLLHGKQLHVVCIVLCDRHLYVCWIRVHDKCLYVLRVVLRGKCHPGNRKVLESLNSRIETDVVIF
jgi:hypothetical protein